jgi:DNA-binding SARP family transcriptional activator/tetratricopeptide (TPR) repeat protein
VLRALFAVLRQCYNRLVMDFRILGPLEVWDRGRPIDLGRRKARALLAMLVLRRGEAASIDELIDGLWGEGAPRTARAALQNSVAHLRRALGPGVLLSRAGGYVLDIGPEQVDLGRFERLAAAGRGAVGEERVERLREAVTLWRGPALADLTFEPFASFEVGRLEELRTAALEDLIDAELARGGGSHLVQELEPLIEQHPFRERLRGQLMLALYRDGRQAEALDAYQQTRKILVDELGIEPSTQLRELEKAILRQDSSLAGPARPEELPASPEPRRKTVTVLMAEVGWAENLDPELTRSATASILDTVRGVLEHHGASIEQRAGDEVMAIFGIPHAHEDDPLRAARAALELKAEVGAQSDELERSGRGGIELWVALETGEVLAGADEAGHGFINGPAIAMTKRLLQATLRDDVLAGPAAVRLLGKTVVAEQADRVEEGAFRLLEIVGGVSLPTRHLEAPLVGRRTELAALRDAFARAVEERRGNLILIMGEAGIGKTRLARELMAQLDGEATVFVGRCVSYGTGATYLPLAEIIREIRSRVDLSRLLATDEHAELIEARIAELTGEAEGPAAGGETFWAVSRLFEELAGERPVMLVFEDLHWAEPTLLELIDYLARWVTGAPLLLLGLARPELLELRPDWSEIEATKLAPLSAKDSDALIENLGEVRSELRSQILRTAGGNPLFIEQLLAHATEHRKTETFPPSLDALLASRLDRLEPGELSVLQRAAVVGHESSRGAVVHLVPKEEASAVRSHLQALVRKGLLHGEETLRFHHVLLRDAAYATLPKSLRADLHERLARWLETRPVRSDELVGFHLEQAYRYRTELGPMGKDTRRLAKSAGDRLAKAGLRAARGGDVHAVSNLLARATTLLDAKEVAEHDLLTELGLAVWRSGDLQAAEQILRQALETAISQNDRRAELRARLELANLRLAVSPEGGADELLSLATEALPVLEERQDVRTLGRFWYVLAFVHGGHRCQYRESTAAAERALGYFRRSGWSVAPCLQEIAAGLYYGPTRVEEAIGRCRALLEEADRGGEANIVTFLAGLEAMTGRFDAARELASRARTIYEELAWTVNVSTNYVTVAADIEFSAGAYVEAERLLSESCRRLEAWGERGHLATQAAQLGEALYAQGRFDEAFGWADLAEKSAASDDASAQFSWRALRAKALARNQRFEEAETLAREAAERASATDAVTQHGHVLLARAEVFRLEGRVHEGGDAIKDAIRLLDAKENVAAGHKARRFLTEVENG